MPLNRIVEYAFFFGFMVFVGYLVWKMIIPFISALALSAIIVTICYPLYRNIRKIVPGKNASLAALLTTALVLVLFIGPIFLITSALVNEALSVYKTLNTQQIGFEGTLLRFETFIQRFVPGFDLNVTEYLKQSTAWIASSVGAFFAGTASTLFLFFISIIGSFYLFRDGHNFIHILLQISPLPDEHDEKIMKRLAAAVRSVATGSVLLALIQGTLTSFGLWLFGFQHSILWGLVAAFGALIPGVGTSIVFVPAVGFLLFGGLYAKAIGLAVWGSLAVGLIDNLLGPYIMSRGNDMHPFIMLLSVLGGISVFGPIGFIVGPVLVSLFIVLIELYSVHISGHEIKIKR